jgi:acyl-CoA synthetase (AMP-forming)/AMP-acid ligase II
MPNALGVDEVWALIVPNGKLNEEAPQKHCRGALAQTHVPVRFISVSEIPRNDNGKVDRARLGTIAQGLTGPGG